MEKLLNSKSEGPDDNLVIFNGVKTLSMWWIILGHVYGFVLSFGVTNLNGLMILLTKFWFCLIPGGYYAVDTFFMLGGFLTFNLMIERFYPKRGKISYGLIYFHRYYRLLPPTLFFICLIMFVQPKLGQGPLYAKYPIPMAEACEKYWWSTILFIMNFYPAYGKDCASVTWYLSCDWQMFLISPFIIVAYCKKRWLGYTLIALVTVICMALTFYLTYAYELGIGLRGTSYQ
jgi:peptidoglycan/LPS O-acetylase OafA/YrhL